MDRPECAFPVAWEDAQDAQAMWVLNETYNLHRMSALDFDLRLSPFAEGRNGLNEAWGMPFRAEPKLINGFAYQKLVIVGDATSDPNEVMAQVDGAIRSKGRELKDAWEERWLPEVHEHLAALNGFDLAAADLPQLLDHLVDLERRARRLWEVHFHVQDPAILAISDFEEAYRDLFPEEDSLAAYELLAGFQNKTVETNLRLWELGRAGARTPALRTTIIETDPAALQGALAHSSDGRELWSKIQGFLGVYGERNDDLYIDSPTWCDDPTPVLRGLRKALLEPDRDLEGELERQTRHREGRLAEVRASLKDYPRAARDEFEAVYAAACTGIVLSEDHHFWLDAKLTHHPRRSGLGLGAKLVELGLLDRAEDVFEFHLKELLALRDADLAEIDLRPLLAERRAEAERFVGVKPPPFLGQPQPFPAMESAFMRAGFKYSGNFMGPPGEGSELKGAPGSRGKFRGPARVIETLDDAGALQAGEILVAPTTMPSWTPFFATASALVTDIGGVLSHAAIVAREYGIPAVVGARGATATIKTGQIIEVDGDAGIVRLSLDSLEGM